MNKKSFRLPRYSRNKYAGRIADAYNAPVSLFAMMNTAPMERAFEPKVLKSPKTDSVLLNMMRLNRLQREKANIGFEEADRQKNILKNKEKEHAKSMSNVINYYQKLLERSENDRNTLRNENAELQKNIKQFPEIQSKLDNIYKMLGYSGAIGVGGLLSYYLAKKLNKKYKVGEEFKQQLDSYVENSLKNEPFAYKIDYDLNYDPNKKGSRPYTLNFNPV